MACLLTGHDGVTPVFLWLLPLSRVHASRFCVPPLLVHQRGFFPTPFELVSRTPEHFYTAGRTFLESCVPMNAFVMNCVTSRVDVLMSHALSAPFSVALATCMFNVA